MYEFAQVIIRAISWSGIANLFQYEFNHGRQPQHGSVWLNLLSPEPAFPIIPVKGGEQKIRDRGTVRLADADFLATGKPGESFYPAARNWAATAMPALVWAVEFPQKDFGPDGFFYSWCGRTPVGELKTFEPVFGERMLKPGEKTKIHYRILVFPDLTFLRAILADNGIDARLGNGQLKLWFAAARNLPEISGEVRVDGRKIKTFTLPGRRAGGIETVEATVPGEFKNVEIVLNGEATELMMRKL